jgi:hypothetical protein
MNTADKKLIKLKQKRQVGEGYTYVINKLNNGRKEQIRRRDLQMEQAWRAPRFAGLKTKLSAAQSNHTSFLLLL